MGILLSFHWGREQQLRQRVQFIYPHLFPGSCLSSCPGSLLIADLNADQTLFFLEPFVVGGTASLLGNVDSESGAEDGEGNEVDDRGGCFWFSALFFVFSLVSFHFSLGYLVFLHFCFRSFDLSFFTFSLRASFWSWLVLVEHLLCRSFLRSYSASGECILRVSTHFRLRFLSFGLVLVGYLFVFRLTFVPAFMGLSVHAFIQVYHTHPVGRLNPS